MQFRLSALLPALTVCFICSCGHQQTKIADVPDKKDEVKQFIPVTDIIQSELNDIDSMPVTPLKIITLNGKDDSVWMTKKDIRIFASPFLVSRIDSDHLGKLFSEKSFFDQTVNAYTFSYDPILSLPDSITLKRWDVYIDPKTQNIQRIYILKQKDSSGTTHTTQLTWKANHWCSITYIDEKKGKSTAIRQEKMIWNFND